MTDQATQRLIIGRPMHQATTSRAHRAAAQVMDAHRPPKKPIEATPMG
jgi:hypothetical protein